MGAEAVRRVPPREARARLLQRRGRSKVRTLFDWLQLKRSPCLGEPGWLLVFGCSQVLILVCVHGLQRHWNHLGMFTFSYRHFCIPASCVAQVHRALVSQCNGCAYTPVYVLGLRSPRACTPSSTGPDQSERTLSVTWLWLESRGGPVGPWSGCIMTGARGRCVKRYPLVQMQFHSFSWCGLPNVNGKSIRSAVPQTKFGE